VDESGRLSAETNSRTRFAFCASGRARMSAGLREGIALSLNAKQPRRRVARKAHRASACALAPHGSIVYVAASVHGTTSVVHDTRQPWRRLR
jgi:hypothetical protein